jgi:hypothetical protein
MVRLKKGATWAWLSKRPTDKIYLMKLRHAVALTLVGWYLMVPPAGRTTTKAGLAVPLSQWITVGAFDNAVKCESGKRKGLPLVEKRIKKDAEKAGVPAHDSDVQLLAQSLLRCVSSDDPRLKGK